MADETEMNAVELATELTIAWLGNQNNRFTTDEVPQFLRKMHATIVELAEGTPARGEEPSPESHTPAVSVRKSLASPEHIVSMIDGKPYKSLRRHLTAHGLSPEEYRQRYNLKPDYPMVAPAYSERRRQVAKALGLGVKGRAARAAKETAQARETPIRSGRKRKA